LLKFKAVNSNETYEEVVTYNQIMYHLDKEDGDDGVWHFQSIDAHQGPLAPTDPRYNGPRYNVRVTWDNGEITWEPQNIIGKSVTVAIYARNNDLLEVEGYICNLASSGIEACHSEHTAPGRGLTPPRRPIFNLYRLHYLLLRRCLLPSQRLVPPT
jgi:hypothetical protein